MKVLLGSSSPFRRKVIRLYFPDVDLSFADPDIDEKSIRDENPEVMVQNIARAKLEEGIMKKFPEKVSNSDLVLTLDQVIVYRGEVREKPVDSEEAKSFLQSYSDDNEEPIHCVNGICVLHVQSGKILTKVESTWLTFNAFPIEVVNEMIESGITFKTAGAFSISHGTMEKYVKDVKGCVTSIEGLPVNFVVDMVKEISPLKFLELKQFSSDIKVVLFDMDGLLLDTEKFYSVAQQTILNRFGITFTWEVKSKMMGRKAMDAAEIMIKHYGLEDKLKAEDFVAEREKILDQLFPQSELLPGVERLLLHLHASGIPLAIATSSHKRHFEVKSQNHKKLFDKVFKVIVTGDCVTHSKPDPEIFVKTFDLLETSFDRSQALVFEDAALGVEAGKAAGMKTVLVSQHTSCDEKQQPDFHINSLLNFLPQQFGLPPFE